MASIIPFSQAVPVRVIGISSSTPFCSVISDGKILYSSGAHLILENTHTNEQKIVYTHSSFGQIQFIVHHITLYNEHILAIVIRDESTFLRAVSIIPLNTSILSIQRAQEEPRVVYLKHIEDYDQVESLEFFEQGMFMGVVSVNEHLTTFSLLRTANAEPIFKETFLYTRVLLSSTTLSKQNYITLLLFDKRGETRLCLLAADELSRRLYFTLSLESKERIIQYCFEATHEEGVLLIALTTYGNVLFYKVNEYEALLQTKVNVKMHSHHQKMLITSSQNLLPISMQVSGNKIVLSYHQSKTIQLIQYSIFNPSNYSSVTIAEALEPYPQIHSTHSIRISKDGCSLAVLFKVKPKSSFKNQARTASCTMKVLPESSSSAEQLTQKEIGQTSTNRQAGYLERDQFLALQIDLLSNIIDHKHKKLSAGKTLSECAGQASVAKVEYCSQNNTMFLLLGNQTIKYYDLTPNPNSRGKPEYRPGSLLLWVHELSQQPLTVAAHPLNFSVLLLYKDIIKLHNYNCKALFPAYVVSPIQNTKHAAYSPRGDKIVLATNTCLTIIDAYTFRTINVIALPNIQLQSLVTSQQANTEPKSINKLLFLSNERLLVLSGHNTLSVVEGLERSVHFGFIEQEKNSKKQIVFDNTNQLAIVAQADIVLVLSKATLNSCNKCQVVSKIQITASSLLTVPEIGVCFIGTDTGNLHLLQWPNYSTEDLYLNQSQQIRLFDQPITAIHCSPSMQFLYAVSANGVLAICELKVSEGENIPKNYKQCLLKLADIPLRRNERWLISRNDQERKQRELIKLRGEEADTANHHSHLDKEQSLLQQNLILAKRGQLEQVYLTEIKLYQEKLGLQKITQEISLLKDEFKLIRRRRQRQIAEITRNNSQNLFELFEERKKLQLQFATQREFLSDEGKKMRGQLQNQITFLREDFHTQNNAIQEKQQEAHQDADKYTQSLRVKQGLTAASFSQRTELMRSQFEAEKQKLMEIGQTILSKNRNTHVASFCLRDKISDLNTEKEKVQYDLIKISNEKESLTQMQSGLQASLEAINLNYNRLIKQTRELEQQLLKERRVAVKLHGDLNQIKKDLANLEEREKELDLSYLKLSDDFIGQRELLQSNQSSLKDLTAKLETLKTTKKDKEYKRSLAKARLEQAVSTLARELSADPQNTVHKLKDKLAQNQQLLQQSQLSTEFEQRKANFDKMARDAIKWKALRNTYLGGFRRSYHKLNDENLKLTYQYNDLFKVSQEYRTKITDLQQKIEFAKREIEYSKALAKWDKDFQLKKRVQTRDNIRCSFFGKSRDLNARKKGLLVKKGVCVSLHQESGNFITQA